MIDQFFSFLRKKHILFLYFWCNCSHSYMTSRISMKMTRIAYRNFKVFTSKKTFWISHSPTTCHYNPPLCISHDVNFRTSYPSWKTSRVFKRGINFREIVFYLSFVSFFCLFFHKISSKFPRQRMEKNRLSNGVESRDLEREERNFPSPCLASLIALKQPRRKLEIESGQSDRRFFFHDELNV